MRKLTSVVAFGVVAVLGMAACNKGPVPAKPAGETKAPAAATTPAPTPPPAPAPAPAPAAPAAPAVPAGGEQKPAGQ